MRVPLRTRVRGSGQPLQQLGRHARWAARRLRVRRGCGGCGRDARNGPSPNPHPNLTLTLTLALTLTLTLALALTRTLTLTRTGRRCSPG